MAHWSPSARQPAKSWLWSAQLISTTMPSPGRSIWQSARASQAHLSNRLLICRLRKRLDACHLDVGCAFRVPALRRPDDNRPPYKPVNYDGRFHGPVTVRTALANSYNIPAVKTLDFLGIYDDPNTPAKTASSTLRNAWASRPYPPGLWPVADAGWRRSHSAGADQRLWRVCEHRQACATGGNHTILDYNGNVIYEYQPPQATR